MTVDFFEVVFLVVAFFAAAGGFGVVAVMSSVGAALTAGSTVDFPAGVAGRPAGAGPVLTVSVDSPTVAAGRLVVDEEGRMTGVGCVDVAVTVTESAAQDAMMAGVRGRCGEAVVIVAAT